MANFGCCLLSEGFDYIVPPFLKDIDFWFWKARMTSFIKTFDFDMWNIFINAFDLKLRDRKSTRLNSSHSGESRMPSSA